MPGESAGSVRSHSFEKSCTHTFLPLIGSGRQIAGCMVQSAFTLHDATHVLFAGSHLLFANSGPRDVQSPSALHCTPSRWTISEHEAIPRIVRRAVVLRRNKGRPKEGVMSGHCSPISEG